MWDVLVGIFSGISVGFIGMITFIFLSAELFQSRFIVMAAYIAAILFVSAGRLTVRWVQLYALKRGYGVHRVVLVGNGRFGQELARLFARKPSMGYKVVGVPEIVRWELLEDIQKRKGIDEIIQTDPTMPEEDNELLLDFCDKYRIGYNYIPNMFESYVSQMRFKQIGPIPVMSALRTPLEGWGRIAKRAVDLVGSVFGLVVLAVPFFVVGVIIKLNSKGPVFYKQTRVGRDIKEFEIMKFRSMKIDYCTGDKYGGEQARKYEDGLRRKLNERSGPLFKMKNDPRITTVGRVLRKTRIDELPQLINVFLGDMSLVGPRPHLPNEVSQYEKHHRKLFTIKPGMTGMAQVHGSAGLPFEQEAKMDIGYIENWSLWLDAILLLKTFKILFTDKNAV
jgi:exopolysaccharide biosynthesis polyprenyl glycosylphosphotransferase